MYKKSKVNRATGKTPKTGKLWTQWYVKERYLEEPYPNNKIWQKLNHRPK